MEQYKKMFESRISSGSTEKYQGEKKTHSQTVMWSYDTERHALKSVGRYCELANKNVEQLFKVSSPCLDDHHFKKEELGSVGELSEVCSQIVLKCLYLEWIGRPDISWSVNNFARAVTKWTQARDRRLARLISYMKHGTALQTWVLFQDSDFAGDLEDSRSTSGGVLCIFGSRTFVLVSWMCKNQTAVSHSSTDSEVISFDAGLRMDGLVVTEVLRSPNSTKPPTDPSSGNRCETGNRSRNTHKPKQKGNRGVEQLSHVDHVTTNAHSSQGGSQVVHFWRWRSCD